MGTYKHLAGALLTGVVVVLGAGQARATIYTVNSGGLASGYTLRIDGHRVSGSVGAFKLTPHGGGPNFYTVCTDVGGTIYLGSSYNFNTVSFDGQNGLNPNWGFGNYGTGSVANPANAFAAIQNAAFLFDQYGSLLSGGSLAQKVALQLAVWEALYDTGNPDGFDFGDGRFEISRLGNYGNTAKTIALGWLDELGGPDQTQYEGSLLQVENYHGTPNINVQEMFFHLTETPQPAIVVPEVSTILAGLLLLLPFGASSIRILRRNRTA